MCTRRTGGARYVPDFARSKSDWRFCLQVLRILGPGLSVHARCPVFAGPMEGLTQPVDVHQIGQRSESHLRRSSRQLGYPLLFRGYAHPNFQAFDVCPNNESMFPMPRFPPTGSARAIVPPLQRYYQGTATSCRPSRRASFPSLGDTTGTRLFRSRSVAARNNDGPGVGHPVSPAGNSSVETTGSPKFLGNPYSRLHMFFDPGRPMRP